MRRKLVLWLVLLTAGFLAGFILQFAKLQRVQQELLAGEHSKESFDQAQRIVSSTEDTALHNLLRDILATRDQITADLAKGDAAALSEIQVVVSKVEQTAKH